MKILVTPASFKPSTKSPAMEQLRNFADELVFNPNNQPLSEEELIPLLKGCEGCIAGLDPFNRKVIESTKNLKVISRYGAGVDNVDLAAASNKGIAVCNTPGVNAEAVADLAFGLMLCLARRLTLLDRHTREGKWDRYIGTELHKKTLGILGLGAVGKAVARRAVGFSMKVLACDPALDAEYTKAHGIIPVSFDKLIAESDILTLHLPLKSDTRHIINLDVMCNMKKGAMIINTARGGLIEEAAAAALLRSGSLGGMGMDVYEVEPPRDPAMINLDNVVLTPHTAARTVEATAAMAALSVKNLIDVLSGKACPYIVK